MKRFFIAGVIALLAITNATIISMADGLIVEDNNIFIEDTVPI